MRPDVALVVEGFYQRHLSENGIALSFGLPLLEALACGIPLVSAPWQDVEGLFTPGVDYLVAPTGAAMRRHLAAVLADADMARTLATHGRDTILRRHTCAHRVDELLAVAATLIPAPCEAV